MITLYTFGPHVGTPDGGPFVMTADLAADRDAMPACHFGETSGEGDAP